MNELVRYDAACRAVAEAKTLDEVKDIRDRSIALAAYARQAKNRELEADAVEIRMRATRRVDQLRVAQKESVGLARPPGKIGLVSNPISPTLASQGIDKNLAHQARQLGALSDAQFETSIARARDAVSDAIRDALRGDRDERRDKRLAEIAKANRDLPTGARYSVIYADPPWRYEHPPMGGNRVIENHYPTMALEEICALDVSALAADHAVLYLWATAPKLAECMSVIEAWGFDYRTNLVWVKDKIGMGYYARNQHELLLVARRGELPPPKESDRISSVVHADRGAHSVKPAVFYELIESWYPGQPRIELFSRMARPGWDAWGNQAEAA